MNNIVRGFIYITLEHVRIHVHHIYIFISTWYMYVVICLFVFYPAVLLEE